MYAIRNRISGWFLHGCYWIYTDANCERFETERHAKKAIKALYSMGFMSANDAEIVRLS